MDTSGGGGATAAEQPTIDLASTSVFRRGRRMLVLDGSTMLFCSLYFWSSTLHPLLIGYTLGAMVVSTLVSLIRWRLEVGPEGIRQVQWRTRSWRWEEIDGIWTAPRAGDLIVAPKGQRARRVWIFERVRDAADARLVEIVTAHAEVNGVPVAALPFHLPPVWPLDRSRLRRLAPGVRPPHRSGGGAGR